MINLDYSYSSINVQDLKKHEAKIKGIASCFKQGDLIGCEYSGWYEWPNNITDEQLETIESLAETIKGKYDTFVVCGIGGSYLGSRAVIEAVKGFYNNDIEVVFLGNTFDERYVRDTLNYLRTKNFCVNVISKSGGTLETAIAFRLLKSLLVEKYGKNANERIYATTDGEKGSLRKMVRMCNYISFDIPANIGGRYSVFTPVGLLPLAVAGVDIKKFVYGAKKAFSDFQLETIEKNRMYQYAAYRYIQYNERNKKNELFVTYSPYLNMLSEWWKQLFGESEGKQGKGLFPASANFSTDLHSLGQFVQEGNKILFITQLKIKPKKELRIEKDEFDMDGLNYLESFSIGEINNIAQEGTNKAHYEIGKVDNIRIEMESLDEESIGYLLYFFMCSCMLSAYLLEVNPFDQPGVEFYKSEMKKMLKKE